MLFHQNWINYMANNWATLLLSQSGCHWQLFQCYKRWSFPFWDRFGLIEMDWDRFGLTLKIDWDWFGLVEMNWKGFGRKFWLRSRRHASVFGESPTIDREEPHFFGGWPQVIIPFGFLYLQCIYNVWRIRNKTQIIFIKCVYIYERHKFKKQISGRRKIWGKFFWKPNPRTQR